MLLKYLRITGIRIKPSYVTRQFGSRLSHHILTFQIQDGERLIISKKNGTVPIEPDYRFSDAVDNRFNIFFGLDNVSQRALPVFRQAFRHPVERGGNFGKLLVIAQVESLFVIVVSNLQDPVGQFTDRRRNGTGQADQESKSNQDKPPR